MAEPILTAATTLEAQLIEVASALQSLELSIPVDTRPDNVQVATDTEGGAISVTATIPASFSSTNGVVSMTPSTYL